jgi:hypothetical protein
MDRITELERKLNVTADCSAVPPHTDEAEQYGTGNSQDVAELTTKYQLYNDVIAAAFICGTSRIATICPDKRWITTLNGEFHTVAHSAANSAIPQQHMVNSQNSFFRNVFIDLCKKLDVEEANGKTFLDNSLVMWTQESGEQTHKPLSMPLVCAGSAAGHFNTGQSYDYRNRNNMELVKTKSPLTEAGRPGLSYNQWLGNVLTAMGVPASEWERPGEHGYGDPYKGGINTTADPDIQHPSYVYGMASQPLPQLV